MEKTVDMSTERYYAYKKHLNGFVDFISENDSIYTKVKRGSNDDYYRSIFKYPKEIMDTYNDTKTKYLNLSKSERTDSDKPSLAGVKDVVTDRLVFDFDSDKDLEAARQDTIALLNSLDNLGMNVNTIELYYSGSKGFSVEILTNQTFTQPEFKNMVFGLAKHLPTFDKKIFDPQRVFRVPGTKHQKSGMFKIPIDIDQLKTMTILEIQKKAKDFTVDGDFSQWSRTDLPEIILSLKDTVISEKVETDNFNDLSSINWSNKPKWLSNCKYALQNGFFKEGNRSNVLSALAATYKNQGFTQDITKAVLVTVAQKQAELTNTEVFPENEIDNNVLKPIFSPLWEGGQYTCQKEGWLQDYCISLGTHQCDHDKDLNRGLVDINNVTQSFLDSTANIDENLIQTGFQSLDKNVKLLTSTLIGILGAPGSGKSTAVINILKHNSAKGMPCLFYSLDMSEVITFAKFAQMSTGKDIDNILDIFTNKKPEMIDIINMIKDEYKNVQFNFNTGIAIEDIKNDIHAYYEKHGRRPKLIVIDYLECLTSSRRDMFDSTTEIAHKLKRLVNTENVAVALLLQPNKISGDPSSPIMSYNSIKGPQTLAAECRTIISVHREGFNPMQPEDDQFITFNVIKNTFGGLSTNDFKWDGRFGTIKTLEPEEKQQLKELRARKNESSDNSNGFS
jgi:KaiC/GvpD/RAD55 family RecA-like ATPase